MSSKFKASSQSSRVPRSLSIDKPKNPKSKQTKTRNNMLSNILKVLPKKEFTSATKKIYGFVKKSVSSVPQLLQWEEETMLPKLDRIPKHLQIQQFIACEQKITEKFHSFQEALNADSDYTNSEQLISIQTSKCYRHVPPEFFKDPMPNQFLSKLLTVSKQDARQQIYALIDYRDEVQFNLNQQVVHKMRIFLDFIGCLNSIQQLVGMSHEKVQLTRSDNKIVRDLLVHRSKKIRILRIKHQNMQKMKNYLDNLKKIKILQSKLVNAVQFASKGKLAAMHAQYCEIHEQLRRYCCPKFLCKYWDVNYYVQKGYQEYFMKSLKSYLTEIIVFPHNPLKKIFFIRKNHFQSVPISNLSSSIIEQSMEIEDCIMLVIKDNIEKQIVSTFKQGMHRCSYATQQLSIQLRNILFDYRKDFYQSFLEIVRQKNIEFGEVLKIEVQRNDDLFQQINKLVQFELNKLNLAKYGQVFSLVSQSLLNVLKRSFSIMNKLLETAQQLQAQMPQRLQVISAYFMELSLIIFQDSKQLCDKYLATKVIKDNDLQKAKKVIDVCKTWENFIRTVDKKYPHIHSKDHEKRINVNSISNFRSSLIKKNYDSMHNNVMNKDLKKVLEEDTFQMCMVNPRLFNILGYILDGATFLKHQKNMEKKLLSSSLLLDKSMSGEMEESSIDINRSQIRDKNDLIQFQIFQDKIVLQQKPFRIIQSTQFILEFIYDYMQNYDEHRHLRDEIRSKLVQFILIYTAHLKWLIVQSKALELPVKKIKSVSINAKILCLTFIQLRLMKLITANWDNRINLTQDQLFLLSTKLTQQAQQIKNKFNKILELRLKNVISTIKSATDIPKANQQLAKNLHATFELINDLIMDESIFNEFTAGTQWKKQYIAKLEKHSGSSEEPLLQLQMSLGKYSVYLPQFRIENKYTV